MLSWFKNRFNPQAANLQNPDTPLTDALVFGFSNGDFSDAGVPVSRETAMRCSAVWAASRLLAETVAGMPLRVYRRIDKGREEVKDHPLVPLLQKAPNRMMTAFTWLEMGMHHKLFKGNSYAALERNGRGDVVGIYPLVPEAAQVKRYNGALHYYVQLLDGRYEYIEAGDMLHVPGPGWDGVTGYTPINMAMRNSVGLALATEQHGSRLFSNGTNLAMTLETAEEISPERQKEILAAFNDQFRGTKNANKTAILPFGLKANTLTMSSEEAQFLETRKFQVTDIARIFNVPPHMIGDLEKSSFNNIEQQNINFLIYSVRPWLERIESELNRKLLPDSDYFIEFDTRRLLRGDFKNRMDGLTKAVSAGIFTPNEAREEEGLNPKEGGDELRVPLNTAPISETESETDKEEVSS